MQEQLAQTLRQMIHDKTVSGKALAHCLHFSLP